jgi:hypothetical protein
MQMRKESVGKKTFDARKLSAEANSLGLSDLPVGSLPNYVGTVGTVGTFFGMFMLLLLLTMLLIRIYHLFRVFALAIDLAFVLFIIWLRYG